ncbi:MAG: hypothetical protein ABFD16_26705 [Thermoguttaceae bacterium]
MSTQTRTATQTSTLTKVIYVTRKLQADLFALVDTYGQISESYAQQLVHDLRLLLDEEVVDKIQLLWTRRGTTQVAGAYSYQVIAAGIGLADDRSGNIRYDATLQVSEFSVRVYYNNRWNDLSEEDRRAINSRCTLTWGPGGTLDFSCGSWTSEKTYSRDGFGLGRERFARY